MQRKSMIGVFLVGDPSKLKPVKLGEYIGNKEKDRKMAESPFEDLELLSFKGPLLSLFIGTRSNRILLKNNLL